MHTATFTQLFAWFWAGVFLLMPPLAFSQIAMENTDYHCTIITSFTKESEPVYMKQFAQLRAHLAREKVRVWHLTKWQNTLDARGARQLRKQWQLRYRKNNAVLIDNKLQLLHRYEQGFDLVDALMRCKQAQEN